MRPIEQIIQNNNDHTRIIEILVNQMNKSDALTEVLSYKLSSKLSKQKLILIDQTLNGLHQLCQTT